MHRICLVLLVCFCLNSVVYAEQTDSIRDVRGCYDIDGEAECSISFLYLLAHPEVYHNKKVIISAVITEQKNSYLLHSNCEASKVKLTFPTILIPKKNLSDYYSSERYKRFKLDSSYVIINGVFSATERGAFSMTAGSILQLDRMDPILHRYYCD